MMRAFLALAMCVTLGACFSSEHPLFDASDAAAPFADGAHFAWRSTGDSSDTIIAYRSDGSLYSVAPVEGDATPMKVLFVDIPETPEQDFIAQFAPGPSGEGRLYAFGWQTDAGFRFLVSDGAFREDGPGWSAFEAACGRPQPQFSGCRFTAASEVRALYRDAIYPAFVAGGAIPADYTDQIPLIDAKRGGEQ